MDEKWFFLTQDKERYLLHQYEKTQGIVSKTNCILLGKCSYVLLRGLALTPVPILGGMINWEFGQLEIGNQQNGSQRTGLREHWCGKKRLLLRKFIGIYIFPNSFHPSWRNDLEGTCCQGKFSFNKMGQKTTLVGMTSYSMMHW